MARPEQYQQGSLCFPLGEQTPPANRCQCTPSAPGRDDEPLRVYDSRPNINGDPDGPLPNYRLRGDFWNEYRNECEFRERNLMESVSPHEFAAMRDWSDRLIEPGDTVWPHRHADSHMS
jgi:hypothetical protein